MAQGAAMVMVGSEAGEVERELVAGGMLQRLAAALGLGGQNLEHIAGGSLSVRFSSDRHCGREAGGRPGSSCGSRRCVAGSHRVSAPLGSTGTASG